jgi:glutathione S-transferase
MTEFTIYLGNKNYSSWSLRPWLALKHAGAAFEEVLIPLDQADSAINLRRHSPSGRVPVLQHGALTIWETLAICEYLAEQFPDARLWPADRGARAHARAISNEMHAGFAALRDLLPMDISRRWPLGNRLAKVGPDVERVAAIWRECRERFGSRGANGAGDFLFGGFTIADAMFAPVTTRFVTYSVPLDPVCSAYVAAMQRWPAMQDWTAAAKAEPWVINDDVNTGAA